MKNEKLIVLLDEFSCCVEDYKLPISIFNISFKKDGLVVSVNEDCSLTEYARMINNDDKIVIETSVMSSVEEIGNMMGYFAHLLQEMRKYNHSIKEPSATVTPTTQAA